MIYQAGFEDVYHQKRGNRKHSEIWLRNRQITVVLPLQKSKLRANCAFVYSEEGFRLKIPSPQKYDLDVSTDKGLVLFSAARRVFPPFLQMGLSTRSLEISGKRFQDYSFQLAVSPLRNMNVGLTHRNVNFNYFLELYYKDSYMDLPVNWISQEFDRNFTFSLMSNAQFTVNWQEVKLKENKKLSDQSDFLFRPGGDISSFSIRLNLNLLTGLQVYYSQKSTQLKGTGDFYYLNQKFGKVTSMRIMEERRLSGISFDIREKHQFSSEVEMIRISGGGKGHLETWPFTPTLIDLLGQRLNFRLSGAAEILRLGLEYHSPELRSFSLRSSVDYLRIRPLGRATTWNPVFLTFGIKNLKKYVLESQRVDVLFLKLALSHKFRNLLLDCNFYQFIPIHRKTTRIIQEDSNQNTPIDVPRRSTGGGRTVMFSLSYRLP